MSKLEQVRIFDMPLKDALKKAAPYLAIAALTAFFCYFFLDKISRNDSHQRRMWLAVTGIVLLVYRLAVKGLNVTDKKSPGVAVKIYFGVLTAAAVFGIFNYYNFDKKLAAGIGDGADISYYYLNTKYLKELGYFGLYAAEFTADMEHNNRFASKLRRYRDLRDYKIKSTSFALEHGREIKEKNFTKERWEAFKHDVDYFFSLPEMDYRHIFPDHGYNPPPTWAVPGYALAGFVPVEKIKWIAMVDVAAVVGMLIVVAWAFNLETALFAMLFFLCTFSGRWPILGHSLLRFDWPSALIIGICLLKKEKWALAGVAMGYAALNRIFPAIFFFPWLVVALSEWWKTKKLPMHHLKFAGGAAAITVFLVVTALGLFGTESFVESKNNLLMHNDSFSSHRVGLANLFVFDGETTKKQIRAAGGMHAKELDVQSIKKLRMLIGLITLAFIGYYILRVRRPVHELIHLAAVPLFCMTTPQVNYYNLRIIFILWHMANIKKGWFHKIGLAALFAVEVVAQHSQVSGNARFATNSYTSYGLFFYYLFVMAWMVKEILEHKKTQSQN